MKRHLVNVWFELPDFGAVAFSGYITTPEYCPKKLFEAAFKKPWTPGTVATPFRPAFKTGSMWWT